MSHLIKQLAVSVLSFACLLFSLSAHADFRKALDAYIARDGETMLKEVKHAVDTKNDDGLDSLLITLLKGSGKSELSSLVSISQKKLFFKYLSQATLRSNLDSQYLLAVIPRNKFEAMYLHPDTPQKYIESRIKRLIPIANKKHSLAAFNIYQLYINSLRSNQNRELNMSKAIDWLRKAAEYGNTQASFELGMKQLNIEEHLFGCKGLSSIYRVCPQKNEAEGWYWMKKAANQVSERDLILGDLAYQMGKLYQQGINGEAPNNEEAYRWYLLSINSYGQSGVIGRVIQQIAEMHKKGELIEIAPQLDLVWGDAKKRNSLLHPKAINKYPSLFNQKLDSEGLIFSLNCLGFEEQCFDVYADGSIKRVFFSGYIDYQQTLKKVSPAKVQSFLKQLGSLGINEWVLHNGELSCGLSQYCSPLTPVIQFSVSDQKKQKRTIVRVGRYSELIKLTEVKQINSLLERIFEINILNKSKLSDY